MIIKYLILFFIIKYCMIFSSLKLEKIRLNIIYKNKNKNILFKNIKGIEISHKLIRVLLINRIRKVRLYPCWAQRKSIPRVAAPDQNRNPSLDSRC